MTIERLRNELRSYPIAEKDVKVVEKKLEEIGYTDELEKMSDEEIEVLAHNIVVALQDGRLQDLICELNIGF